MKDVETEIAGLTPEQIQAELSRVRVLAERKGLRRRESLGASYSEIIDAL